METLLAKFCLFDDHKARFAMIYTFHLRSVTEIFAGGADIQNAELRPSAFRGPLRFWFRAMMGKVVGNDLERLRQLEAAAFGATDSGSPFVLRLAGSPKTAAPNTTVTPSVGKVYLGFSLYDRANGHMRLARGCIPSGQNFTLSLHFKRPDQKLRDVVLGSLWLLLNFGGVGSRTRRGFGCLAVRSVELNRQPELNYFSLTESGPAVDQFYRRSFQIVENQFRDFAGSSAISESEGIADHTSFTDWDARLVVRTGSPPSPQAADHWFNQWGILLRSFRNDTFMTPGQSYSAKGLGQPTFDYKNVVAPTLRKAKPKPDYLQNDVFGLPLGFESSLGKMMFSWRGPDKEKEGRRASPLILHPVPLPDGRLATLAVFFVARFLPEESELVSQPPVGKSLKPSSSTGIRETAEDFFKYIGEVFNPRRGQGGDLFIALPDEA